MSATLRYEDYIAFLDESGGNGIEVVAGVLIPARWLRSAEQRWRDFIRDELGSRSGMTEVKGADLIGGNSVSIYAQKRILSSRGDHVSAKGAGRRFFRDALEHVAGITEVRILTVGMRTKYPVEVYRLWFWLIYALLVERDRSPRPRLPMTIIDGEDRAFRSAHDLVAHRFYRSFPHCQSYVSRGRSWFVGGSALQDSRLHPFVQMADLVAVAGRHAIAGHASYGDWYQTHLTDYAKGLHVPRDIDVSAHAITQLRRRSKHDACGSGWPGAMVVRPKPN